MNFETVITILIVFIVVVFQLLKRLSSGKTETSGKTPAWKQKLVDALSQIREELKTEMTGDLSEPAYRDHIVPEATEPETVTVTPPKQDYRAERVRRTEELSASKTDEQKEEVDAGFMDLQLAIIWSEILAPPLALRNERGDQ